jgi:hypothetical protein
VLHAAETFAGVSVFDREFWDALEDIARLCNRFESLSPGPGILMENNTISIIDHTGEGGSAGGLFPVLVRKDGGVEGSKTTRCTFTYTVWDMSGDGKQAGLLGEKLSPMKNRTLLGRYVAPTRGDYNLVGLGYNHDGKFFLWDANEVQGTAAC